RERLAPRTEAERRTAEVFGEVLGTAPPGVEDGFFELGGDSILSIRLAARLAEAFGTDLTPRAVFLHPTPAGLARLLTQERQPCGADPAVVPVAREAAPPMSYAQQRLWFLEEFAPGGTEYVTALALRLHGALDLGALGAALNALVARHESLRTTFDSVDGRGVQLVHQPREVPLALHDLSELPEQEGQSALRGLLADERGRPFDLRRGPLLRVALVRLADGDHVLAITLHHIVTDGWSMGVVLDELCTAYAALVRGAAPQLPPVATQYPDFAVWQREQLSGTRLEKHLAYWKGQLAGAVAPELPLDRPRRGEEAGAGAIHTFPVSARLTARLRDLVTEQHSTLYTALVAATQALLARWSGQDDITVGSLTSGRSRTDLERAVGCFVNTVVLRTPVERSWSFRDLLSAATTTVNDSFVHGDTPFERLVETVGAPREAGRNPLFDVMVLLHPAPPAPAAAH
ncbi:condensation domain-containing protein, partial [Kitasatospora sp. NPDC058263]